MSKRYVFWQTPEGLPSKGQDDKHAPVAILREMGLCSWISEQGVSRPFRRDTVEGELAICSSAVIIGPDGRQLNEQNTHEILSSALVTEIRRLGGKKPIIPSELRCAADKLAAEYFREPEKDFAVITTLSVDRMPRRPIHIRGCSISGIMRGRAGKWPLPESLDRHSANRAYIDHVKNTRYLTVKIAVRERSSFAASDSAIDALHLLRGLWTLAATRGSWKYSFGRQTREPFGVIYNGPIHTVHFPDGKLSIEVYWFEPDYVTDHKVFSPGENWKKVEGARRSVQRRIAKLPYRDDLERLIIRYVRALDNPDPAVAFLQLAHRWHASSRTAGRKATQLRHVASGWPIAFVFPPR